MDFGYYYSLTGRLQLSGQHRLQLGERRLVWRSNSESGTAQAGVVPSAVKKSSVMSPLK